jgi:phosphoribosylaminoimidazolecarboxamide formyltransferase/IMP cyclohydrolase
MIWHAKWGLQGVKDGTVFSQSGGSVRDNEIIEAADRLDAATVFDGVRRFRH